MQFEPVILLFFLAAYLLGSIPTAVWIGKIFYKTDVRQHGSGNAGATNVLRVLGTLPGVVVLIIDAAKGAIAVSLSFISSQLLLDAQWFSAYQLLLGFFALIGHVYPVFAGFKGGKGIATLTGILVILFPKAMIICFSIFLVLFLLTRYVSLGSITASLVFPIAVIWLTGPSTIPQIVFALIIAVFVPLSHRKNIERLLKGTENKIVFKKNMKV